MTSARASSKLPLRRGTKGSAGSSASLGARQSGSFRLFVSHLARRRQFASRLQECLVNYGISCFVAHKDIVPSTERQHEIITALTNCEGMLALLHPGFHTSPWPDQEIGYALARGVPIAAINCGEKPYGFVASFQAFDGRNKTPTTVADEVFGALCTNRKSRTRIAESTLSLFEPSGGFKEALERIGHVERLAHWNTEYASRLRKAVRDNSQVRLAYRVPARIGDLIEKWAKIVR